MASILVKVQPILDETKAKKIEDSLVRRFQRVSKTFGGGLRNAVKFGLTGGAIGLAMGALLDPIKEADEKLNSTLAKASDIKTRAAQFGSESADYLALQTVAQSKGVDQATLISMLTRIQQKIGEAKQGQDNELAEFKNETDIVGAFVKILDSLNVYGKKEGNEKRAYLEGQIFGSKSVGKLETLFQSDINKLAQIFTSGRTKELDAKEIDRISGLEEKQSKARAKREYADFFDAGKMITAKSIILQDKHERNKNELVNKKLSNYEMYAQLQETADKLLLAVTNITSPLVRVVTPLVNIISWAADKLPGFTKQAEEFLKSAIIKFDAIKNNPAWKLLGFRDH
jgi:hypothetical protein